MYIKTKTRDQHPFIKFSHVCKRIWQKFRGVGSRLSSRHIILSEFCYVRAQMSKISRCGQLFIQSSHHFFQISFCAGAYGENFALQRFIQSLRQPISVPHPTKPTASHAIPIHPQSHDHHVVSQFPPSPYVSTSNI